MVGLSFHSCRFGTIAIFATLLVALRVTAENCVYDFESENGVSNYELECNGMKNSWDVKEMDIDSKKKKALVLNPETAGCVKTRDYVTLNSSSKVLFSLYHEDADNGNLIVRLHPTEGVCRDEECVWNVEKHPDYKTGKWVVIENQFPVKGTKNYYVQVEAGKSKGKFALDYISFPSVDGSNKCHSNEFVDEDAVAAEFQKYVEVNHHNNTATCFSKISKNLILTSASVLTLNHILN